MTKVGRWEETRVNRFYPVSLTIEQRDELRDDVPPEPRLCMNGGRDQGRICVMRHTAVWVASRVGFQVRVSGKWKAIIFPTDKILQIKLRN